MEHKRWVRRYRPQTLEEYIADASFKERIARYIEEGNLPHLILHSPAGYGKTSLALLIAAAMDAEYLLINASDENSVDVMREKVKGFATMASMADQKIIILDEADRLTAAAQDSLKVIVETYANHTTFIFLTNHFERIDPTLKSRSQVIEIKPGSVADIGARVCSILDKEGVVYDKRAGVLGYMKQTYPDIRKLIDTLQDNVVGGQLKLPTVVKEETTDEIIGYLIAPQNMDVSDRWLAIQTISRDNIGKYDTYDYYRYVYDNIGKFPPAKRLAIVSTVGQYLRVQNTVPDREINWMSCVSEILTILYDEPKPTPLG